MRKLYDASEVISCEKNPKNDKTLFFSLILDNNSLNDTFEITFVETGLINVN